MKLGDLCNVVRGSSPRPQGDPKYFGGNIPRLMIADITRDGKYVTPIIDSLTEEGAKKSRPMKKGDVIVAVSGDPGRPCILAVDACIHDGFVGLRDLNENKILKPYLFCFLNYFKLANKKNAVGAIFQNLTTDQIKKIDIPEVSINKQINIVKILTQAENLIAQRKESILLLDELLKSTFLEMFGDPVRNEKGWGKTLLKKVARIKIGPFGSLLHKEDYVLNGIPLVNPSHIKKGKIEIDLDLTVSIEKMKELTSYIMLENDIVLGRRGEIGRCAVITKKEGGYLCGTGSIFIRPNEKLDSIYLYTLISSASIRKVLENSAKGITMKNLNSGNVENLNITIPPIKLQNQFATIVEKVETLKTEYQASLKELENMYGVLSQKAFKGELKVKEYTNTEVLGMVAETKGEY